MISILAWRLSSLRPQRLGAIRCINAKILRLVGKGRCWKLLPRSRELLISLNVFSWCIRHQLLKKQECDELTLALTFDPRDKHIATCWVTSTVKRTPNVKCYRATHCSKAGTGFPRDCLKVVGFLKCLQRNSPSPSPPISSLWKAA